MTWNHDHALSDLRDVLAGLYPAVEDARRVVQDAGLRPEHIVLEGKAVNFWADILDEAQKNRQVQAIVAVARKQYPRNEGLARAGDRYLQWIEAGNKELVSVRADEAVLVKTDPEQQHLTELRQILVNRFGKSDLQTLCFDLGVGYDILPGDSTADKARELVLYLERRGRIPEIVETGRKLRPDIPWPSAPDVTGKAAPLSRSLAPAGLQELEAESARRIRSRPEEHVPQDSDIHIAQKLHWDREPLVRTFLDMIRRTEVEKGENWRVLAIQGSEDAHVRALVTRFEEICKQVTTSLPLLVARVSLEQDSPHRLAHAILSDLYMTADRSRQPVICKLAEPLLETCAKIEHGLPGRRMTGVLPMSEAQVARELTKCLEPITQDCTAVVLLEDFEKIEDETGRWLRDQWLVSSARDELGVVIVITGESGLGKLVNFAHYGILYERLPIIKWEDFRDWARRGYHLSEQDVPDETLRKMYDDLKESTKDLVKYLKFKKMEIS